MKPQGTLLYACFGVDSAEWKEQFAQIASDLDVRYWPDAGEPAEIDYALTWNHPPGLWSAFPNLKAIFSQGAGVDQLLRDPDLPRDIPVVRLVDTSLVTGMDEFVLMRVLHHHRDMPAYAASQRERRWMPLPIRAAEERVVGVMGLGQLGGSAARKLAAFGFDVRGWSRRPKAIDGVRTYSGAEELPDFLAGCEILVCLLPLTRETEGILDAALFEQLARPAHLINVGRGRHLVENDLTDALDKGWLAAATLDVFASEPLPPEHPFWADERITITPHVSAPTQARTAAAILVENVRRAMRGEPLADVVDRAAGY